MKQGVMNKRRPGGCEDRQALDDKEDG